MNTATDQSTNDPLGYKRFALTESAYDLITSLTGVYARLRFQEEKQPEPDAASLATWSDRADQLQDLVHTKDWSDRTFLHHLITELTAEYKAIANLELNGEITNAPINPIPVSSFRS